MTTAMEKYEQISIVGEGSYGVVMKCRHKDTDQLVAIKKFLETEEDAMVRKMALREIRMLKRLRHENLVTMIEVFRHRKRFHLVFEFVDRTVLDELERLPQGLGEENSRERIFQVTRAVQYCHANHIIHRDVKPENVLVSSRGVVKLCDFGFARILGTSGEACTDYVATRWYRAPELLVGELQYGPPVDIWAIGCLFSEMMTGEPLFPGDSDIDQLYLIAKLMGKPCSHHQQLLLKNPPMREKLRRSECESSSLHKQFSHWPLFALDFLGNCLRMDPANRPSTDVLLRHNYFTHDRFASKFLPLLREKVVTEFNDNPLLRRLKAEVLISTDAKREELPKGLRRPAEPGKWKINFTEGSVKRKLSSDTVSTGDENKIKSSSKLGTLQSLDKMLKNAHNKKDEKSKTIITGSSNNKLNPLSNEKLQNTKSDTLEKALDMLARLSQKSNARSNSVTKDQLYTASSPPHVASPHGFQSLQPHPVADLRKSPQHQNILHPNVQNITFTKDQSKKHTFQSVQNGPTRTAFNQIPVPNYPRTHLSKRLDRNVMIDTTTLLGMENVQINNAQTWLSSVGVSQKRREQPKKPPDDFTLPNVPGASGSPPKNKKKSSPESTLTHLPTPMPLPKMKRLKLSTSNKKP